MSNMPMTTLQVDVLVHAGIHGPAEASNWFSLVDDPDAVGRSLFPPRSRARQEYVHQPLPFKLTAAEILKACAFYGYNVSRGSKFISHLRIAAAGFVPGIEEAPWDWTGADVVARSNRDPLPVEPPKDNRLVEVIDRFAKSGLELDASPRNAFHRLEYVFKPGKRPPIIGTGMAYPFGRGDMYKPSLSVLLGDDAEGAELAWVFAIGTLNEFPHPGKVWQWGNLVVFARFMWTFDDYLDKVEDFFASWGAPDRTWSTDDPPRQTAAIANVWQHVEMRGATQGQTFISRTAAERDRLAAMITSDELRGALSKVDAKRQSVLVLVGDDRIDEVSSIQLHDTAWWNVQGATSTDLEIQCTKPEEWSTLATVIVCDRLEVLPYRIRTHPEGSPRYFYQGPPQLPTRP